MGVVLLKRKLTSFQIIILGFSGVILFGTFLLMLPFSSRSGLATPFSDALFTSTSAVCVTGLIIHDTATYWAAFGQFVILLLIQIGGMGVITIAASFAMISGRKISLIGGLKWNCQDKIRISFFMRSVTMHPLRKAENSKSFSVMPQVSERPMPCFRRLIRLRSVASMWLLDT